MKKLMLICGVAIALGASAFTINHVIKAKAKQTVDYFQYSGSDENSGSLTSSGNWTYLSGGLPGTSPCSFGTNIVCVTHINDGSLPSGPNMAARFASYLSSVAGGAKNYVDANLNYQKP